MFKTVTISQNAIKNIINLTKQPVTLRAIFKAIQIIMRLNSIDIIGGILSAPFMY